MMKRRPADNQTLLLGFGILIILAILASIGVIYFAFNRAHEATRYPGTTLIASRNDYQGLPRYLLVNKTYVTSDSLEAIYQWYASSFHLALVAHEVSKNECYVLYQSDVHLTIQQDIGVLLCATPSGQTIQVTQSILIR